MTRVAADVVVVGAGVVGCALARRLTLAGYSTIVVDRALDVGEGGASKANSAIVHTGFDCEPGSLEAKLVTSASLAWPDFAKRLKIPYLQTGAIMLASTPQEHAQLTKYWHTSRANGVMDCELILGEKLCEEKEPVAVRARRRSGGTSAPVTSALHIPREAVADPFAACYGMMEVALKTGRCELVMGQGEVARIIASSSGEGALLRCESATGEVLAEGRVVINSAGLGAAVLHNASSSSPFRFTHTPRRGQFLVYSDRQARRLVNNILLPVPTAELGKGILIAPTIFGNLLCGPTAEDLPYEAYLTGEATQTTSAGLDQVRQSVHKMLPPLAQLHEPTAQYAGARSQCDRGTYQFDFDSERRIVTLAGIRSTGFTASFAIADHVVDEMERVGMIAEPSSTPIPCPGRDEYPSWYQSSSSSSSTSSTKEDLVCYCERVTKEDISRALKPLQHGDTTTYPPATTDAVKRRTRATAGACQGFHCLPQVCKQIASERKLKVSQVGKQTGGGDAWFPGFVDSLPSLTLLPPLRRIFPLFAVTDGPVEHFQTIVVGSGPAGLGVLSGLVSTPTVDKVLLVEQSGRLGGIPARYADDGKATFLSSNGGLRTGMDFARWCTSDVLASSKVHYRMNTRVVSVTEDGDDNVLELTTHTGHRYRADSIVLATGAREASAVERGVTGSRTSRTVFANHLLETGAGVGVGSILSVGAGLIPRSLLPPPGGRVDFIAGDRDEWPQLARWWFGGNDDKKTTLLHVKDDGEYDAVVLGGQLRPYDTLMSSSSSLPNVYVAGNAARRWPALACYYHGKYVISNQIRTRALFA